MYLKLAMVLSPALGSSSFSWRMKVAMEAGGHTVFVFMPSLHPWIFTEEGEVRAEALARFVEVQRLDALILGDGLRFCADGQLVLPAHTATGIVCESVAEAQASAQAGAPQEGEAAPFHFDFALSPDRDALEYLADSGVSSLCVLVEASVDTAFCATPLANDIAYPEGLLCIQDATPKRIEYLRLKADARACGCESVFCFGKGWPAEWTNHPGAASFNAFVYAARSSRACVVFAGDEGKLPLSAYQRALLSACGCEVVVVRDVDLSGTTSPDATAVPNASSLDTSTVAATPAVAPLEESVASALAQVCEKLRPAGKILGVPEPRVIVSVLGYFGMGNFGDEYILATLDQRIRQRCVGSSVIAVSERPQHTLEHRGIYALGLKDKTALDEMLSFASVALVAAGLLFDQGIRWTSGKSELFSETAFSDIPGIAAYALLAAMNGAEVIFYGIGAGPLEDEGSRRLVYLMSTVGARFLTRDSATARLIGECGVPSSQVIAKADAAFLGECPHTDFVEGWLEREGVDLQTERLLAVSLRDYENLPPDFSYRVAAALDALAKSHGEYTPVLCILDPADRRLASEIVAHTNPATRVLTFDPASSVEAVCDLLARACVGLSMRYHCSLVLNSLGKPCVGLGYLPKVVSLYEDMGTRDLLLEMDATTPDLTSHLETMVDNLGQWEEIVSLHAKDLKQRACEAEDALIEALERVSSRKRAVPAKVFYLYDRPASAREYDRLSAELNRVREELAHTQEELESARHALQAVEGSRTMRAGKVVTYLPKKVRGQFRRSSQENKKSD